MIDYAQFRFTIGIFNFKITKLKYKVKPNYNNHKNIFLPLFLLLIILGAQTCNNYSLYRQKSSNKNAHYTFGNKKGSYKLLHWNKGNSDFKNKYDDICMTLDTNQPEFFSIQEANFNIKSNIKIKGYNIEYNNLIFNNDIARTVLLIKNNISYKRRYDLENNYISSVWVQVNISKSKYILICSYYRQWQLPNNIRNIYDGNLCNQVDRYKLFNEQITKATASNHHVIILTDDNINSYEDNSFSNQYKNIEIKNIRDNSIISNCLIVHNNKPTFFRKGIKTCIDHIYSNCPINISNVRTHDNDNIHSDYDLFDAADSILSDHAMISCTYSHQSIKIPQQFKIIRNNKLLTKHSLNQYFDHNHELNRIFNETDPDAIAEILINELSLIIETISPSKKIQCSNSFCPWLDDEYRIEASIRDNLHTIARTTNTEVNWRLYRQQRNKVNRINTNNKTKYYEARLNKNINNNDSNDNSDNNENIDTNNIYTDKGLWRTVRNITNNTKMIPPRIISYNNSIITSIKTIANIANEYFIRKIDIIRSKFTDNIKVSPMDILRALIPEVKDTLVIPVPSISDIADIIKKSKASHSLGNDIISMSIIKKLTPKILPHITHLVTRIIVTEKYPKILKVTRISPNLKPLKDSTNIDSYRPICNLSVIDKIAQQYIKNHIVAFFDTNNVIIDNHHGSRKNHSTVTALAAINHHMVTSYHNNKITAIIQTDLSCAFDTVDHITMINKLYHYGIRGSTSNLLKSILSDRYQYVSIDGIKSEVLPSLECSVLQGSKLSSVLYNTYCNEIPLLYKLMNTELYQLMTNHTPVGTVSNMLHNVIQYVDDSTNVISTEDETSLQSYINDYFKILEAYYNINKLLINSDKSKLMISCKPSLRNKVTNITLKASQYVIEQSDKIKVLGTYITSGLTNLATINDMIAKINFRRQLLYNIFKYSKLRTKIILTNSLIISIFRYASPLLINSNINEIKKLQTLLMKCSRPILGYESYKLSTTKIMQKLKWLTIPHLIMKESILFLHKVIYENLPKSIFDFYTYSHNSNQNIRSVRKIMVKNVSTSEKAKKSLIYKSAYLFNQLPEEVRMYNKKKLSKYLQTNINIYFHAEKIGAYNE